MKTAMNNRAQFRLLTLTLATAGVLSVTNMARAEMPLSPRQPSIQAAKSAAGTGGTRFDWLAKRSSGTAPKARVVQKVALGQGSWVCSPAGFNRKSSCYRR